MMLIHRRFVLTLSGLAIGLLAVSPAQAQRNPGGQRQYNPSGSGYGQLQSGSGQSGQSGQEQRYWSNRPVQGGGQDVDRLIASWLADMNQCEIEMARYVEGKAHLNAINRFAREIIQDHQEVARELQRYAPNAAAGIGSSNQNDQSSGQDRNTDSSDFNFVRVSREIVNEKLRMAKKELRNESGLDFDWAFVGQQVSAHDNMIAEMKVLRRYTSSGLRQVIDSALSTARDHREHLDSLMSDLKQAEMREQRGSGDRSSSNDRSSSDDRSSRNRRSSDSDSDSDRD